MRKRRHLGPEQSRGLSAIQGRETGAATQVADSAFTDISELAVRNSANSIAVRV